APDRQDVVVTPDLLKKLETLTQRGPGALRGAVLVSAAYEVTPAGEQALCRADFQLFSFGDKSTLTVPLAGVELREGALLDGAAVFPQAAPGGYTVPIRDKGAHQLTLLFSVRCPTAGDHRDLRFSVPRLHQSRLTVSPSADGP